MNLPLTLYPSKAIMIRYIISLSLTIFSSMAMSAPSQSQFDAALAEVKAEEMVFDAEWLDSDRPQLLVRMFDNGVQRNGYAGYICMLLEEHGITDATASVIDVVSKDRRELGRADCKQYAR